MNKVSHLPQSGHLTPNTVNGKVPPKRLRNKTLRSREHLTEEEVNQLMGVARKTGRHGHRDATLILMAYRHGLRVSELIALRWDQVDYSQGLFHVAPIQKWHTLNTSIERSGDTRLEAITA
jgi:site-specific recombinase XerD